jgi:ribosomal protein S24E
VEANATEAVNENIRVFESMISFPSRTQQVYQKAYQKIERIERIERDGLMDRKGQPEVTPSPTRKTADVTLDRREHRP